MVRGTVVFCSGILLFYARVWILHEDLCVWKQSTTWSTHLHPLRLCAFGCKGLCSWSCLSSLSTREINTGTNKVFLFFFFFFTFVITISTSIPTFYETKEITEWLVDLLFLPLSTQQHNQCFRRRTVCFSSKTKSIDTANALCVCEDIHLNILPEWLGTTWQNLTNSQNKVHFSKGEYQY